MKWEKLGKIFDPKDFKLPNNCIDYAQSPQTIVFDNYIRIFFSTRERDITGKFLSHIAYVDFTKDLKQVIKVSDKTIIELGVSGCYDEHGIFPLNVLKVSDQIYGYIGGWARRKSVSIETSVGVAISKDNGETFQRIGNGPVLTSSLHNPFLVGDPFVTIINNKFYMYYIFGTKWLEKPGYEPQRVYKITQTVSDDGINWENSCKLIINDKINENECQALPTVIEFNNQFHMFFCYRDAFGFREDKDKSYRIGYAYSNNLKKWKRDDENAGIDVSIDGWDSEMMCYPHIFKCDDNTYLLYNGNTFGRNGFGAAVLIKE